MLSFTSKASTLNIFPTYFYFMKSDRKSFTTLQYRSKNQLITRKANSRLVFKRAPKHFKLGKQQVTYFTGAYTKPLFFKLNSSLSPLFFKTSNPTLFNSVFTNNSLCDSRHVLPHKLTLKTIFFFKISI